MEHHQSSGAATSLIDLLHVVLQLDHPSFTPFDDLQYLTSSPDLLISSISLEVTRDWSADKLSFLFSWLQFLNVKYHIIVKPLK